MCGIAGIYSPNIDKVSSVKKMVSMLTHRGPDHDGYWGCGIYEAGMRRLSILDVAGGNQPLYDESGQIVLFYNGEIYNSLSLRSDLEKDGVHFRTNSDGEVICHLYRKYGRNLFSMLDGMFAVALWDNEKQLLILARDYPGEKPLYYSDLADGGVAFSSEIPSLLKCERVSSEIDMQSLWDFPTFLWVPEPATIYKKIRAILPGEGLEITPNGKHLFSFKNDIPTYSPSWDDDDEMVAEVRRVVIDAVTSRLLSDVPVGAFLSGGLDSSIVCMLARKSLKKLHTYCIGFENTFDPYHGFSDESILAAQYAAELGTKHRTIKVTSKDFKELLPHFLKSAGQPYAVSSGLGIMAVSKIAKSDGIKVLLSGDGADEAFGGYSWYSDIPSTFDSSPTRTDIFRFYDNDLSRLDKIKRLAGYSPQLRAWAFHYYASENEKASIFHPDIRASSSLRLFDSINFKEPLDYIRHDRSFYFPNEMLTKLDRMTMAFSVEGRAPFAAPSVQKFAQKLPWNALIRGDKLKWALRQAFAKDIPSAVTSRPKHGFNVPLDNWLKGEWRDLFEETFEDGSPLRRAGILSVDSKKQATNLLYDPKKVAGHVIFTFVMLHIWMRENGH
ncbi:AsnB Asparagine synthase (glutamine-hydrolyzing) [Candidatus Methylopumilus universalis]|uniref:asparagine synthase (glutamine-hydrolyzing) n=1 Tax=Candidatus Methylopumilus universalis TaxID=2588536 RepID=UPI003BEF4317